MVDYRDTADEAEFRAKLRKWIAGHAPAYSRWGDERVASQREWDQDLFQGGYLGLSWPKEWGGQGLPFVYEAILCEEVGNADAPPVPAYVKLLGRAIFRHGTSEQVERFMGPLHRGETAWCQGFSEPGAGSDIANVRTRAVRDGDRYIVNGQKLWTSGAQFADWCFLVVRTDPDVPRHRGISVLLASMKSPGVTVRPISISNGEPETAEVFWDDVQVPVENRLGDEGRGWEIVVDTLSEERGPHAVTWVATHRSKLRKAMEMAARRGLLDDPSVRQRLARAHVDGESLHLYTLELLSRRERGTEHGAESSIIKLLWAQAEQSLHHLVMDMLGSSPLLDDEHDWLKHYLWSRIGSVYGGTSEIQRNVIARRRLAMPSGQS